MIEGIETWPQAFAVVGIAVCVLVGVLGYFHLVSKM